MKLIYPSAIVALTFLVGSTAAQPIRPAFDTVLPARTCECVLVPDLGRWDFRRIRTFGIFLEHSLLERYLRDLEPRWRQLYGLSAAIGENWLGIRAASGGGAAWAVVVPANDNRVAWVLLLDTRGKATARDALMSRLAATTKSAGGTVETTHAADLGEDRELTTYTASDQSKTYHVNLDEMWVVTNDREVLSGMVGRWGKSSADSLANHPSYQFVKEQTKMEKDEPVDVRWFVRPFLRAQAGRLIVPWPKKQGQDPLKILQPEGFDAILASGGCAGFGNGERLLTYRSAIHAPKPPGGYINSMRIAKFPNGPALTAEPWVPSEMESYFTARWDVSNGFQSFGSMFDRLMEEDKGTFDSIIHSLKDDPDGPGVDVRKDIVATLDNRVSILAMPEPHSIDSTVVAIPTHDEKTLAKALRSCFVNDRRCAQRVFEGHTLWVLETKPPKASDSTLEKSRVFAAANGYLFAGSRADLVERVIRQTAMQAGALAQSADFQQITNDLNKLVPGPISGRVFGRLATDTLPNFRKSDGKPSIIPNVFPGLFPRPGPIFARKVPKPDEAAAYGYTSESLADGFKIVGVLHKPAGK
jgi:hypothetical protein